MKYQQGMKNSKCELTITIYALARQRENFVFNFKNTLRTSFCTIMQKVLGVGTLSIQCYDDLRLCRTRT